MKVFLYGDNRDQLDYDTFVLRQAGLQHYRRHLVGHSEGYENHEPPVIGTPLL